MGILEIFRRHKSSSSNDKNNDGVMLTLGVETGNLKENISEGGPGVPVSTNPRNRDKNLDEMVTATIISNANQQILVTLPRGCIRLGEEPAGGLSVFHCECCHKSERRNNSGCSYIGAFGGEDGDQ